MADDGNSPTPTELLEALAALVSQIDKNDFRDGLGHDAKMLKAFIEARAIIAKAHARSA